MKVLSTTRSRQLLLASVCLPLIALLAPTTVGAVVLATGGEGADSVHFESTATLEFIAGSSTDVIGWFDFDRDQPQKGGSGLFRVDLRTLKTGIDLRDEHMRENHLHTEKYPYAWFEVISLAGLPNQIQFGETYQFTADGMFYLHGIKRKLSADMELVQSKTSADRIEQRLKASFSVLLEHYQIPRPKLLLLKVAREIELAVTLKLSSTNTAPVIELPKFEFAD